MKTHKIGLLTALLVLAGMPLGCSISGPLREDAKATGYQLGALPSTWKSEDIASGADAVFFHKTSKSLISFNSVCDRYPDTSLESLSQDLLTPMKNASVFSQEDLQVSGRRALFTSVEGKLDGVDVKSYLVVLRKNRCLFDFSLYGVSPSAEDRIQFLNFVKGFHFQESK